MLGFTGIFILGLLIGGAIVFSIHSGIENRLHKVQQQLKIVHAEIVAMRAKLK